MATLLHDLVQASGQVAATRARLQKIAVLAALLGRLRPDEVCPAVAFLSGAMPGGKVGLGPAAVRGVAPPPAASPAVTVLGLQKALDAMRALRGTGAQKARLEALAALLARATPDEQGYLRRLVIGELRQGALEGVMVEAVARAAEVDAAAVRRAVMLSGDAAEVAAAALSGGAGALSAFGLELFRPLQPMLAQTADGVGDAIERLGEAALEWKLDGARVQVHRQGDDVRVFTRRLHDVTAAVPEVVEAVRALPVWSVVLDGETLALRDDGRPHPFQVTMRRFGRKLDVEALRASLPLGVFFFDCLHLDGDDVIDRSGVERVAALAQAVPAAARVPREVAHSEAAAAAFLERALAAGHEGIMAKDPAAGYEAGRRGAGWLKVKPVHTLDLVVLAAEWGSGRRKGWLSNLHLGARDPATGGFVMLGKTFKGMTDAVLAWQTERLLALEVARDGHVVHVKPELVVEVAFDGVQESRQYPGGVALRFARLVGYRDDKRAESADAIDTLCAVLR